MSVWSDPELRELLLEEARTPEPNIDDARARVWAGIAVALGPSTVGSASEGHTSAPTLGSATPSAATSVTLGGLAGGVLAAAFLVGLLVWPSEVGTTNEEASLPVAVGVDASVPPTGVEEDAGVEDASSVPPVLPDAAASARLPRRAPTPRVDEAPSAPPELPPLSEEQELLDQARHALAAGLQDTALEVLTLHETRYPRSRFVQERERMLIEALALNGHADQARRRGERFLARFPNSVHGAAVRQLLSDLAGVNPRTVDHR